jgi:hypothetical protein
MVVVLFKPALDPERIHWSNLMSDEGEHAVVRQDELIDERRRLLLSCGRFAMITPPTMTLRLASGQQSFTVAGSGASSGGSLSAGRTFFPGDHLSAAGGVHPGDTVCFKTAGGTACHGIQEPSK